MVTTAPKKSDPNRPLRIERVYAYDPATGLYMGEEVARESPLDEPGKFMQPVNTTSVPPPDSVPAGQAPVWNGSAWTLVPDSRGETVYSIADGSATQVRTVGAIPAGYTMVKPASGQKWNGSAWVGPSTPVDTWDGSKWVTSVDALHKHKLSGVAATAEAATRKLTAGYTQAEMLSWAQQLAEARLWLAAGTGLRPAAGSTPLLDALAAARVMDETALAQKIVAKNAAYAASLATVVANQRAAEAALANATTVDALTAL